MMLDLIISMAIAFSSIMLLNLLLRTNSIKLRKKINWQHYLFGYMFLLYLMIALLEVVGFPSLYDWSRRIDLNQPIFDATINLIPFSDGLETSQILNIIFFMPFGFLLPTLWGKYRRVLPTVVTGFLFSMIIEIGQLFVKYRATDINDLIMNTLGTLCGWIIFKIMSKVFHKLARKTMVEESTNNLKVIKLEPYLYILIAIISAIL